MAVVVVACVIAFPLALLVHELGHWLAAHALGGRNIDVHITKNGAAVAADFCDGDCDGDGDCDDRARVLFLAAGPLASVAGGVALIVAGRALVDGGVAPNGGVLCVIGAVSVVMGIVNAWPHGTSDGAAIVRTLRRNDAATSVR